MKIKDFIDYEQPSKYIVDSDIYDDNGTTPVLTAGQSFILGYTNETNNIFTDIPVIIFDDFTTSVQYADFPFKVKSSAMKILRSNNKANLKYCYYLLKLISKMPPNHKRQWISTTSELEYDLPDLDKQNSVVEIIDKISDLIRSKNKQINLLDEAAKSRFIELFGDPILNDKNLPTDKLNNVCPINKYKGEVENIDGKVWTLNLDMIESNTGKVIDYVYCTEDEIPSSTIKFNTDCVLYSKLRPYLNKVVIPNKSGYGTSELLSLDSSKINKYYLSTMLMQESFVDFANGTSYGAKMPRASVDAIKNFDLMIPPIELQNQFAEFAEMVDKSKFVIQQSLDKYQQLFDSLMQEYFG